MRIRIRELLAITAVVGFACSALKLANPLMEILFFTFTLLIVLAAAMMAIARAAGDRAYWLAFLSTSLGYLLFSHMPDHDGLVPRHDGPEATTQVLRAGFNWLHYETFVMFYETPPPAPQGGMGTGFFLVPDDMSGEKPPLQPPLPDPPSFNIGPVFPAPTDETYEPTVSLIGGSGQRIVSVGNSHSFMRVGHSFWALLLAWLAGRITQVVYERTRAVPAV